jgi:nitroimidazol reductase NimA-like FMN-containing flavoprotein (pyridoxamine 5'-phosphate oxidase superfamily)
LFAALTGATGWAHSTVIEWKVEGPSPSEALAAFDLVFGPMALAWTSDTFYVRRCKPTGVSMEELGTEHCLRILEDGWVGHLGVIAEGEPYVTPISYIVLNGRVCFKTVAGRRTEAIRSSPRVCLETSQVDNSTGHWESVVVWGIASEITDDLEAQAVISALISKYQAVMGSPFSPGPDDVGLLDRDVLMELPIETITGRSSGSFFHISTRPGRL